MSFFAQVENSSPAHVGVSVPGGSTVPGGVPFRKIKDPSSKLHEEKQVSFEGDFEVFKIRKMMKIIESEMMEPVSS